MNSPFTDELLGAGRPLVMEVKRQDADGNDLLNGRSVAEIVAGYAAAGAPCLSVVTGRWFGGTEDLLREVAALTALPLLRKDFIVSRRQLVRTRELGADAVLLTAALLPAGALRRLVDEALTLGLTPFVEVANEAEAEAVPCAGDCVVAVNNKDISTREREPGSLGRSSALLPAVLRSGTPCPVSASGIRTPQDAARLVDEGFRGLLIGTGLLRSYDLRDWCERFDSCRRPLGVRPHGL